jgi:serine/threonine-protein kinase
MNFEATEDSNSANSASQAAVALHPGETILGKFKIVDLLGQGGVGSVYRVDHVFLGRQFALKCLNKQQPNDVSWRRFQNEAKAASKLDHPNLIKVHEFDLLADGRPFILMDLVVGETLADLTKHIGSMPVDRAVKIMIQVAFAVQYAHDQGVIHRDLKPTNIMVVKEGAEGEVDVVKLVDFGIAKLTGIDEFNQQTLTKTGEIFGSPLYMSPEQCTGTMVDYRTDIYSLGCVFFELLTGAPPFMGENALSTMMKHQTETPMSLKEASLGTVFPAELEEIVAKLLEKDPDHRYQNANALAADLIAFSQKNADTGATLLAGAKQAISPRQGQTTQFLPRSEISKAAGKRKQEQAMALVLTSLLAFGCGFALASVIATNDLKKPNEETKNKAAANEPAAVPAATFVPKNFYSDLKDGNRCFRFPSELEPLGKLTFNEKILYKAYLKLMPIPADRPVGLLVDKFLLINPYLWDWFRQDDLSMIDFRGKAEAKATSFVKLGRFTNLRILNVMKTEFSGADLQYLEPNSNLIYLNIAFCPQVNAKELVASKILPRLRCLAISEMKDAKSILKELAALPRLRQLVIANCGLTDDDLAVLSTSKSIKLLSIAGNAKLTDAGISHLKKMKQLTWLVMSETNVTAKCAQSLAALPNLTHVEYALHPSRRSDAEAIAQPLLEKKPNLTFFFDVKEAPDTEISMPEFPWNGPGLNSNGFIDEEESRDFSNSFPMFK